MYFTQKLSQNTLRQSNTIQPKELRLPKHSSIRSRIQFIESESLLLGMLQLMMTFDDVWRESFLTEFSIQSNKTIFSFWRLCIAVKNLDTGKIAARLLLLLQAYRFGKADATRTKKFNNFNNNRIILHKAEIKSL
jgi:hypothetical protein